MDLEDLLEDLLEDAGTAARRQVRKVSRSTAGVRRTARRTVRAGAGTVAVVLLVIAVALATVGTPGGIQLFLAAMALLPGLLAGGIATAAHLAERRDPVAQRERARRKGLPEPPTTPDVDDLPKDVRRDWQRLLQARRLVQDLAQDGWIERASLLDIDGMVLHLHRLLVAERRTTKLGGRPSPELRTKVSDLADLLVALADEAVHLQVEASDAQPSLTATLADAQEHLALLREARREVGDIEQRPVPGSGA
ncbi:MAG TPA: hypothetical protein VMM13_04000 [Euzebya sp.]|nr:hypothetical protein [Euzebya sp.]